MHTTRKDPNDHLFHATARDAVSSSRVYDDETPTRSHLSSGIVDERQTYVWPGFLESAHTRVMSPNRVNDYAGRRIVGDWTGQLGCADMNQPISFCNQQRATTVRYMTDVPNGSPSEHDRSDRYKDGVPNREPLEPTRDQGSTRAPLLESTQLPCDPSSSSASTSLRGSTGSQSLASAQRQVLCLLQSHQMG